MRVTVECSRCHTQLEGLLTSEATSGFYDVREPSDWALFADSNEEVVCDACMHADVRYRSVYAPVPEPLIDLEELIGLGYTTSFLHLLNGHWRVSIADEDQHGMVWREVSAEGDTLGSAINWAYLKYLRGQW